MKIRTLAAAALSVVAAPAEGESELAAPGILLGILGAAAVVAGVAVAASGNDDDSVSG